ncbi:MAG: cupin domain-containing protein [Anaerolineae bacterium]|jgi:quercetin dioxygenase-like cupin family protein|nr:cupin domain-containing protein [Anaerolineae bacterium]MDH7475498.1 cupin domain-containing protein [Anaerolineae bacterium]
MFVKNYQEVEAQKVEEAPGVTVRWVISEKDGAPHFAMRVFEVQPGYATPYHPHWFEHEVFVLAGQGKVRSENAEHPLQAGNVVFIPGEELHQFVNTGDEVLRFICLIPHAWLRNARKASYDCCAG